MTPQGHCDSRFAPLAEAFARLFDNPQERGAALCLEVGGETVVDLWGGVADKDGEQPWQRDTILNLFSCTKTFTAVAVLQLVAEGKLELDAPVARYWPEFAAAGKAAINVRQLLCHRAGLPALREQMPPEALYDWQAPVPSPIRRRSSPAPTSRNGDACSSRPPMAMATRARSPASIAACCRDVCWKMNCWASWPTNTR